MFVIVSTRMVKLQITELCVVIRAMFLVFMHIVAVMKVVLDPLLMILFQKESHHSEKQSYVQTLKVNVTFDKLIILVVFMLSCALRKPMRIGLRSSYSGQWGLRSLGHTYTKCAYKLHTRKHTYAVNSS